MSLDTKVMDWTELSSCKVNEWPVYDLSGRILSLEVA